MLDKNPNTRATVVDLLDDPWLTNSGSNFIVLYEAACDLESNRSLIRTDSSISENEEEYNASRCRKLSIVEDEEDG